jgi:TfoX/Sxy family transcriptional regulator of competence genes
MAYDEKLADRIRTALQDRQDVTERRMFGGLAFLIGGRMGCGVRDHDLMVRVPADEVDAAMQEPHVRPMDFTGRPLRGFAYVSADGVRTAGALSRWLARAIKVAVTQAQTPARRRQPGRGRPREGARP